MSHLNLFLLLQTSLFLLTNHNAIQALTSPSEISALKVFKASIKPSSIPSWSCLASWDFTSDPCTLPHRIHFTCGLTCSPDSTFITQITLDPAGYSGTLSPLISRLTHLSTLDLSENSFTGSIPPSISSLSSLQILTLRSNSFTGSLPPSITTLKSLESLDISRNSLSGSLPNSMSSLSNLRRLDLSFNRITGSLPIELPPNLLELALKSNSLSGPLSKSSFVGLTQLEVIELSQNSISGVLGSWFFLIPSLQQVDLANNSLTAVDISGGGNELVAVDLGFNRIEGYAPAKFGGFPRLSSLSVRYNRLRGKIPVEYGRNKSLKRLYLDGNYLNGQPPPALLTGRSGISGSLGDNCLEGCPASARLCLPSQKSNAICKQAYGGRRGRGRPRS